MTKINEAPGLVTRHQLCEPGVKPEPPPTPTAGPQSTDGIDDGASAGPYDLLFEGARSPDLGATVGHGNHLTEQIDEVDGEIADLNRQLDQWNDRQEARSQGALGVYAPGSHTEGTVDLATRIIEGNADEDGHVTDGERLGQAAKALVVGPALAVAMPWAAVGDAGATIVDGARDVTGLAPDAWYMGADGAEQIEEQVAELRSQREELVAERDQVGDKIADQLGVSDDTVDGYFLAEDWRR